LAEPIADAGEKNVAGKQKNNGSIEKCFL